MNFPKCFSPRSLISALLLFVSAGGTLHANTYFWQTTGTSPLADGGGTWSATGTNWYNQTGNSFGAPANTTSDIDTFGVNNGAAGTITVSGSVNAGTIVFNPAGSGNYTLSSGTIALAAAGVITVNSNATIQSTLAGAGTSLTVNGGSTLTLTGSNSYTGTTIISFSKLTLDTATGSLKSTSPLTLNGGTYNLDNTGATAAYSGTLGALTFNSGDGTVSITESVPGDAQELTFASLAARTLGATGNFVNGNDIAGGSVGNSGTSGFVITGKGAGFIDVGEYYEGGSYAWYSGTNVRAINYGTDASTATNAGGPSLSGSAYQQITGSITAQPTATITSLNLTGNSNLTLATSGTLTVNGLLASGTSTIGGGAGIQAGSGDMVIRTNSASDSLTISTDILPGGSNALTKSGAGTLTLSGTNSYTGTTYLDGGTLLLASANPLGSSPFITFQGGTLEYSSSNTTDYSANIHLSTSPISINTNGQSVTFATGLLGSNTGGLTKSGSGTLILNGGGAYTGGTIINSGTLLLGNATALGGGANNLTINAGALNLNGNGQTIGSLSGSAGSVITNGTSTTAVTLVINENQSSTFAGSFQSGPGGSSLGLTIQPTLPGATFTLSGSSTVNNGISINPSASANTNNDNFTVILTGTLNLGNSLQMQTQDSTFVINGGYVNSTSNFLAGHGDGTTVSDTVFILNKRNRHLHRRHQQIPSRT